MSLIVWNDTFSVGHAGMDAQHQRLVGLLNDLHKSMTSGNGNALLRNTIGEVVQYTRVHFQDEERLMEQAGYARLAQHRMEHQQLLAQLDAFRADVESGKLAVTIRFLNFLKEWLLRHILGSDKAYSASLKASVPAGARR